VLFALTGAVLALAGAFGGGGGDGGAASAQAASSLPRASVDRFDGGRAMALVRRQVRFGPRPAGSPALRRLAADLRRALPRGRFEPVAGDPPGMRNVVGTLPGRRPALVIGAHYDTEATVEDFVGANDGAAGTAVAVEVGRALRGLRRPANAREIRIVLFDGEEEPAGGDGGDFYATALRGSKAYVRAHARDVRAMVLLDYVGNRGLRLPREGTSDLALWAELRRAARDVGVARVFPDEVGTGVIDDHTPFLRAGIPAIDLIDFTYEHRDTPRDTVDKLDPRALDAVGETVVQLVRRLDRQGF
jgi:Zn-dependent M28 family amino/carboxypeptidase